MTHNAFRAPTSLPRKVGKAAAGAELGTTRTIKREPSQNRISTCPQILSLELVVFIYRPRSTRQYQQNNDENKPLSKSIPRVLIFNI